MLKLVKYLLWMEAGVQLSSFFLLQAAQTTLVNED